jgi:hypothetical protein
MTEEERINNLIELITYYMVYEPDAAWKIIDNLSDEDYELVLRRVAHLL